MPIDRRCAQTRGRVRSGPGFTLVEVMVTAALSTLLVTMLYQLWFGTVRYSADIEDRVTTLQQAQLSLAQIVREIQESRRLLYPAICVPSAGNCSVGINGSGPPASGVSVVNAQGVPVLYGLAPAPAAGNVPGASPGFVLTRTDLSTGQSQVVLQNVRDFICRTASVPEGRDPDLVNITVSIVDPRGWAIPVLTSVRLRSVVPRSPIDRALR